MEWRSVLLILGVEVVCRGLRLEVLFLTRLVNSCISVGACCILLWLIVIMVPFGSGRVVLVHIGFVRNAIGQYYAELCSLFFHALVCVCGIVQFAEPPLLLLRRKMLCSLMCWQRRVIAFCGRSACLINGCSACRVWEIMILFHCTYFRPSKLGFKDSQVIGEWRTRVCLATESLLLPTFMAWGPSVCRHSSFWFLY